MQTNNRHMISNIWSSRHNRTSGSGIFNIGGNGEDDLV